ncbi:hypothetical protein [Lysobacter enzymogenes]|uniref:hypothetical protein n=1 Tax=Lysobacter enzymogenes TaxID=69 RepID=UPI001AF795DF|nr:hypothetical protein [Lysobacter enzymogenes]QQQ02517.1 hypothetical protein JHW41_05920 [Lysobacter enzymogenes]
MELLELLQLVEKGPFTFHIRDSEFSDVLDLIDGQASGAFNHITRSIDSMRDGDIGEVYLSVQINGLSLFGEHLLLSLDKRASNS